jgi:hypothetical protein
MIFNDFIKKKSDGNEFPDIKYAHTKKEYSEESEEEECKNWKVNEVQGVGYL